MSESNSEWYLRHRDGVVHGPFQLAELIAAARSGNIASDTVLRHEVHSHNQWVFATRVQPVAEAMTGPTSRSGKQTPPSQSPPKQSGAQAPAAQTPAAQAPATQVPAALAPAARTQPTESSSETPPAPSSASTSQPVPTAETSVPATAPNLQSVRRAITHSSGFPVPKTFFEAVLALFDFRFHRFVTPWIIQFGWVLALLLTLFFAATLAYTTLVSPAVPSPAEVRASDSGNWQFDPFAGQTLLESEVIRLGIALSFLGFGLLGIRVLCEGAIIFFRIAIDIRELKVTLREREKAGID